MVAFDDNVYKFVISLQIVEIDTCVNMFGLAVRNVINFEDKKSEFLIYFHKEVDKLSINGIEESL